MTAILQFLAWWGAVLILLGASVGQAYLPLGRAHDFLPVCIAALQAGIILVAFMNLRGRPSLKWIFAGLGFYWLMIFLGLASTDFFTRTYFPSG